MNFVLPFQRSTSCRHSRNTADRVLLHQFILSALLLARVSNAGAQDITYNIVDYPTNEADGWGCGTDTISGTIITDGTIGPLSTANIVGGSFSFVGANGSLSGPAWFSGTVGLEATPTQLILDPGSDSSFSIGTAELLATSNSLGADAVYENYVRDGQYYGSLVADNEGFQTVLGYFDSAPVPTEQGSIGESSSWVIATVPEPDSLFAFVLRNAFRNSCVLPSSCATALGPKGLPIEGGVRRSTEVGFCVLRLQTIGYWSAPHLEHPTRNALRRLTTAFGLLAPADYCDHRIPGTLTKLLLTQRVGVEPARLVGWPE